jgi:hypothetical protein
MRSKALIIPVLMWLMFDGRVHRHVFEVDDYQPAT